MDESSAPAGGEDGSHRVSKTRISRLLGDQKLVVRVQDAVQRLHGITANALIFGKLLYMSELDRLTAENGGVFDTGVALLVTASFPIDAGQMEEWIDVVSSRLEK